jgi:hypothetical protein
VNREAARGDSMSELPSHHAATYRAHEATSMTTGRFVPQYRLARPTEGHAVGNQSNSAPQHQTRLIIVMESGRIRGVVCFVITLRWTQAECQPNTRTDLFRSIGSVRNTHVGHQRVSSVFL